MIRNEGKGHRESLATKIRYSYLLLLIPIILVLLVSLRNLWTASRHYEDMMESVVMASEFSLDFKADFDYETYLVIVGNKSMADSSLKKMLTDAGRIVNGLQNLTRSAESKKRLLSAEKYLKNLEIYRNRIEENLEAGNRYEENMEIWENDVQIVTSLFEETVFQYIYYELKDLEQAREAYRNDHLTMLLYSFVAFGIVLLLIVLLSYFIPLSITKPLRNLIGVTERVSEGDLSVRSDIRTFDEVGLLSDSMNDMIDKINSLLEQVKGEQTRLRKAEFQLLQSQINPHFLYNTLDAIVWLAESGEQKQVVHMVGSLSDFFRTSLSQGKDIVTIREELVHVKSYLAIQQVRYQDILQYEIHVPEELNIYLIPKLTIQPVVENALYHGVKNRRGVGTIEILGIPGEDSFYIEVKDTGIGMTPERLSEVRTAIREKKSDKSDVYGLYNVNERIRLNFGEAYGIEIDSAYQAGTTVRIHLPYMEVEKNTPRSEENKPSV